MQYIRLIAFELGEPYRPAGFHSSIYRMSPFKLRKNFCYGKILLGDNSATLNRGLVMDAFKDMEDSAVFFSPVVFL